MSVDPQCQRVLNAVKIPIVVQMHAAKVPMREQFLLIAGAHASRELQMRVRLSSAGKESKQIWRTARSMSTRQWNA